MTIKEREPCQFCCDFGWTCDAEGKNLRLCLSATCPAAMRLGPVFDALELERKKVDALTPRLRALEKAAAFGETYGQNSAELRAAAKMPQFAGVPLTGVQTSRSSADQTPVHPPDQVKAIQAERDEWKKRYEARRAIELAAAYGASKERIGELIHAEIDRRLREAPETLRAPDGPDVVRICSPEDATLSIAFDTPFGPYFTRIPDAPQTPRIFAAGEDKLYEACDDYMKRTDELEHVVEKQKRGASSDQENKVDKAIIEKRAAERRLIDEAAKRDKKER